MKRYLFVILLAISLVFTACATGPGPTTPAIAPPAGIKMTDAQAEKIEKLQSEKPEWIEPMEFQGFVFLYFNDAAYEDGECAFATVIINKDGVETIFIYEILNWDSEPYHVNVYTAGSYGPVQTRTNKDVPSNSPLKTYIEMTRENAPKGFRLGKKPNELEV